MSVSSASAAHKALSLLTADWGDWRIVTHAPGVARSIREILKIRCLAPYVIPQHQFIRVRNQANLLVYPTLRRARDLARLQAAVVVNPSNMSYSANGPRSGRKG